MLIIWSFGSFSFFLVPFYLESIEANFYALSLASEVSEILGSIICLGITRVMKLERALFMFCSLIVISSIAMMVFKKTVGDNNPDSSNLVYGFLIMLTNLGAVCSFDIAYLINP
jgi:hypothetical protein